MFTGIIECIGVVSEIVKDGSNYCFRVESPISGALKVDQSVAHDGVCLTVVEQTGDAHRVVAVDQTVLKTTLSAWELGRAVNLERCVRVQDRLDGHVVQGHVDRTLCCTDIKDDNGSYLYRFEFPPECSSLLVPQGSVCINGISFTVAALGDLHFSIAVIPYTMEHTNIKFVKIGSKVNVEFDIIGKYVLRHLNLRNG